MTLQSSTTSSPIPKPLPTGRQCQRWDGRAEVSRAVPPHLPGAWPQLAAPLLTLWSVQARTRESVNVQRGWRNWLKSRVRGNKAQSSGVSPRPLPLDRQLSLCKPYRWGRRRLGASLHPVQGCTACRHIFLLLRAWTKV